MADRILPRDIYALAERVVQANAQAGRKVALAESCTGGLVSAAITEVPGSSSVLDRAFITYSNESKCALLGVAEDILETFGAVSAATAWAMAQGALARSDADVAVSISGIAGPGGGSELKPVGLVVFARCERESEEIQAEERQFDGTSRSGVRHQAALCALELLLP
ncbi:competence damage-inducible protein A [Novosphingobium marinum]|uniref:Nicotinamide-nucleotide amidase n=1 Tax=Novosphingobium marinum TaxID=1514948 RepID=A0A7Y9XTK0_9SPHN|nr:CinA family protein [Novosphingobium marinum]NYH94270.1 nicotinamide-nucleotide amidase [Novosphingobium marinum]GGC20997.1 competence damage-inducible protein A [Novosphingobium marinum]